MSFTETMNKFKELMNIIESDEWNGLARCSFDGFIDRLRKINDDALTKCIQKAS